MNILAINTSDDLLSVALKLDSTTEFMEKPSRRNHNQAVLVLIEKLLAEAQMSLTEMDAIAFGVGPGSFTGLRIAAAVAQGIAFGADIAAVPVSCMAAVAQKQAQPKIAVAMDAKRSRIFWGRYIRESNGFAVLDGDERLAPVGDFSLTGKDWYGAGSGWDMYSEQMITTGGSSLRGWYPDQTPHAVEIADLGAVGLACGDAKEARLALPQYNSPYFTA